jgi:S1-C subfamily serine protease
MKKVTLYSRSSRNGRTGSAADDGVSREPTEAPDDASPAAFNYVGSTRRDEPRATSGDNASGRPPRPPSPTAPAAPQRWWKRQQVWLGSFATAMTLAVIIGGVYIARLPTARPLTQKDIDAAVLNTLTTKQMPSAAARSYAAIRPSVVRVRGLGRDSEDKQDVEKSVGSGVVIVDSGMILTNLHVVAGAEKLKVVFFDGSESDAFVVSTQPENDLAVVQAKTLPDDLVAATLRSTKDLQPGDEVIAVGFPFGIGPSVSSGVVSGLRREYRSQDGKRQLTNLIQFDAAANPGSSGGPLVTTDGAVVGIVTGILNRGDQRVFIGIGFAVPIENAAAGVGLAPF